MNYQDILNRLTDNLGLSVLSSRQISTIRRDIFDVMTLILRKAESNRQRYEFTVDTDEDDNTHPTSQTFMPSNFYAPLEVIFRNADGQMIMTKEVTWEKYSRWRPVTKITTTSFNELVTSASPQSILWTQENEDLDGCVAYTFLDTEPIKMIWKPPVNADVEILYIARPTIGVEEMTDTPMMHASFHEAIVDGVTQKILVRRLKDVKTEIELIAVKSQLIEYGNRYKEAIADFAGFVNKTVEPPMVEPFDFLNDPNMRVRA